MSISSWRVCGLTLGAALLALSAGSCGKVNDSRPLFDSNTNWLVPCQADNQCSGSLRCYCGQCTQPCAADGECARLGSALCAESGEALCGESASVGGLCVRGCQADAECGSDFSCVVGQCVPNPCSAGQCTTRACGPNVLRDWDQVFQTVNDDLNELEPADRAYARYLSFGNESELSDPGTGLCEPSLERKRQALSKLLNSLSSSPTLSQPVPVDSERRLVRIDLRSYSWDRRLLVGNQVYADFWEALVDNDAYALAFIGDDADDAVSDTLTAHPVLLADAFLASASEPQLYYAAVGMPESLELLSSELGLPVDAPAQLQAGFVENAEFLAQRWELAVRAGFLWQLSELGRSSGALFEDPLAVPLGEREIVYTLPNGLLAFAFLDAAGLRQDTWSVAIDPRERDRLARAPRSNWRRHASTLAVRDQVLEFVLANPNQYQDRLAEIQRRFPGQEELSAVLERDYAEWPLRALQSLGVDPSAPDPISRTSADFEQPVTLDAAAALLLIPASELLDNLDLLDPALRALEGGTVTRRVFTALYRSTSCTLSVILTNQPDPNAC